MRREERQSRFPIGRYASFPSAGRSAREGVPLNIIQRQLGHATLGTTSIYLQGIDREEITATVHVRRAPMISTSAGLQL